MSGSRGERAALLALACVVGLGLTLGGLGALAGPERVHASAYSTAPITPLEDEPATLEEYTDRVDAAHELVIEAGADAIDERDANDLAATVNTWVPMTEEVALSDDVMTTDNSILRALTSRLAAAESTGEREALRSEIEQHLASMLVALRVAPGTVPEDAEALSKVLGEQVPSMRSPLAELLGDVAERILEWLQDWWGSVGASPGAAQSLTTVTLVIMLALVTLLVVLVVRAVARARQGVAAPAQVARAARPSASAAGDEDAHLSPAELAARADALAAEGRLREAVRALMAGATRLLAAAGLAARARTTTNGELLREVRGRAAVHDALTRIAGVFDRAWYGHAEPDGAAFSAARAAYRDLERALVSDAAEPAGGEVSAR